MSKVWTLEEIQADQESSTDQSQNIDVDQDIIGRVEDWVAQDALKEPDQRFSPEEMVTMLMEEFPLTSLGQLQKIVSIYGPKAPTPFSTEQAPNKKPGKKPRKPYKASSEDKNSPEGKSALRKLDIAAEWLSGFVWDRDKLVEDEVYKIGESLGHSRRTLQRAKELLGLVARPVASDKQTNDWERFGDSYASYNVAEFRAKKRQCRFCPLKFPTQSSRKQHEKQSHAVELNKDTGRIRWTWGYPDEPDKVCRGVALENLETTYQYYLDQAARIKVMIDKIRGNQNGTTSAT